MSQAPIFDLNLSSTSMPDLLYRNVVSLRKEDMMDDGKVDFSTFTYLMWRPVKSKLQPRYKWTLQSGGGRLLQGGQAPKHSDDTEKISTWQRQISFW